MFFLKIVAGCLFFVLILSLLLNAENEAKQNKKPPAKPPRPKPKPRHQPEIRIDAPHFSRPSMFRSLVGGANGAKAIRVLAKTYGLQVSHPKHIKMMEQIAMDFGELCNEHEMAVQFLAQIAKEIPADHPQARREIEKFIKISKGAHNRGLISITSPMRQLFAVAKERFNIDPENIDAA